MAGNMDTLYKVVYVGLLAASLSACTAGGEPIDIEPNEHDDDRYSSAAQPSSSDAKSSGSVAERDSAVYEMFEWLELGPGKAKVNSVEFTYGKYAIASTEVTQEAFVGAMGRMPDQPRKGDSYPVVNVSWFDAVLFCNELSKMMGFDTAYVYSSVGDKNYLKDVEIDYGVEAIRLPTEIEWEIAAHGGSNTMFYWGNDKASDYVYYGQTSGPTEVASYPPNPYGMYDMAGNAAEWVNDWYGTFPTKAMDNYTGVSKGTARVVRGGGWSDPIKDCAPDVREKKDPLYTAPTLGFRVLYSKGF